MGWCRWRRYSRNKSAATESRKDLLSWNDVSRLPPHRNVDGQIIVDGEWTERNVRREARAERAAVGKAEGIRRHYFTMAKTEQSE